MPEFVLDHVGITTTAPQPQEDWAEQSRIRVTNPHNHPEPIEFPRCEPDSPVPALLRDNPHVAHRVDEFPPHLAARAVDISVPPFVVGDFLEVAFVKKQGMVFEYMRYPKDA